jgi:hypothetical protein
MFEYGRPEELPAGSNPSHGGGEEAGLAALGIDAATTVLGAAARADVSTVDEQELCDAALELERARRRLDAAQCHVLAELHARGTTDRRFGSRTSRWLAHHAGLPGGVARQRVRTANKLRQVLGDADDALTDGRIGFDHARVLAEATNPRISEQMAKAAAELCEAAAGIVFHQWRRGVQGLADMLDQDGAHDPDDDLARNHLRLSPTDDLSLLRAELLREHADVVQEALDRVADELFGTFSNDREHCPDLSVPSRPTLLALALVELCRRGGAVDLPSSKPPHPEVTLVVNAADLDVVTDAHGTPLPARATRRLMCDPVLHPLVVGGLGVPLDMGRRIRLANRAQRRAVAHRDGGCVFPGCSAPPAWTDAHHLTPWRDGGTTDVGRLVSLCRHHHGVAHRRGWSVTLAPDGWSLWSTPGGDRFWGQRQFRQRAGPLPCPS